MQHPISLTLSWALSTSKLYPILVSIATLPPNFALYLQHTRVSACANGLLRSYPRISPSSSVTGTPIPPLVSPFSCSTKRSRWKLASMATFSLAPSPISNTLLRTPGSKSYGTTHLPTTSKSTFTNGSTFPPHGSTTSPLLSSSSEMASLAPTWKFSIVSVNSTMYTHLPTSSVPMAPQSTP
jgi:hypothetical protein